MSPRGGSAGTLGVLGPLGPTRLLPDDDDHRFDDGRSPTAARSAGVAEVGGAGRWYSSFPLFPVIFVLLYLAELHMLGSI